VSGCTVPSGRYPHSVIGRSEEASVRRLVGSATMARGRSYAASGAVRRAEWSPDGARVTGEVQGASAIPYRVSADITRSGEEVIDLDARCTCPVGYNCKHAVALLLAGGPRRGGLRLVPGEGTARSGHPSDPPATRLARPSEMDDPFSSSQGPPLGRAPAAPAWELALASVLHADAGPPPSLAPDVALQLELVAERPVPGRGRSGRPGVRLRPVTQSSAGNWVRSGAAWSSIDYAHHGRHLTGRSLERIALLRELRALATATDARSWHGSGDEVVWLESIGSRRLWDLLRQAGEVGLPLLAAGREAVPVDLAGEAGTAILDLADDGAAIHLRPSIVVGVTAVPGARSLLIGQPAHGVVWWDRSPEPGRTPPLHLAPLSPPLPPDVAALVAGPPIDVPAADTGRFRAEAYPRLRRRVALRSADGSVELPEAMADTLVCQLAHLGGARVEVAWSIDAGGSHRHVWDDPGGTSGPAVAAALAAVRPFPELVAHTPWGERLAPGATLEGIDAVRFVAEVVPELADLDGVSVEQHGEAPDYRELTGVAVVRVGGEEAAGGDWLDLDVEVAVDGEILPFALLFAALAEGQTHLALPTGAYVSLDRPELRRLAELIEEARHLHDAPAGRVRLGRFQASLWEELGAIGEVDPALEARAAAWSSAVRALAEARPSALVPLPAGLEATLRPYQVDGFRWLATRYEHGLGGILADDMGLGKTLQALALVAHARERGLATAPFLVVAPTSVVGNWVSEAARFAPDVPAVAVRETYARRGTWLTDHVAGAGIVVTSYTLFRLEYDEYAAIDWAGLLLDEAQTVKNPASHGNQRARRLPVPWKLALTGTPLENSLTELWALTAIVAPGLFARVDRFAEAYRIPIERHGDAERLDRLRRRIKPVMLRRTKVAVAADLPEKQERILELDLEGRHRRLYDTYLARERQKVLGLLGDLHGNRFEVFRSLTLLRQAALDVSLVDPAHASVPATKLEALAEMLTEAVADGHRVLVFSQFTRFLTSARRRVEAAGLACCYLDGRTRRRDEEIDRFRRGAAPVFLISLKAGGVGLNLTEADHCILLDPWWNPATETQAVDRAHRIGQTRKVMVHRLVARNTIEEKVMALKERKARLFASVMDAGGFDSGALTADDIRELLA
jgi:superfamily II DNA or RNA helicase